MIDTTRRGFIAGTGAAALILPGAAYAAPKGSIVARHGRLQVKGNRVVDAAGKPVTLRGMSLFWSQWMPQFYNRGVVAWLAKDWKVTIIRAAIAARAGGYDRNPERETAKAEAVIDAAIAQGIYVVLDWHAHEPDPENCIRLFTHIATKYRGVPNLIYEPYNEPLPKHGWADLLKPYHSRVIEAVRAIDPGAFFVLGARSWSQDVDEAAADPLKFDNTALVLHFYAATHKAELRAKAERAMERGSALFVTEYGITHSSGNWPINIDESRRWWDWMESHGISYLAWSICEKDEASAALIKPANPNGGWPLSQVSYAGRIARDHLRKMNG
jgi:endoglucanase